MQINDSQLVKRITQKDFIFDLIEFWIAGVIGLAIFGSIVVTVVHGGLPWECEEHVTLVSGAANLGFHMNQTHAFATGDTRGSATGIDALASHYECEYMSSTASFGPTLEGGYGGGMCSACSDAGKEIVCNAHKDSLGCTWYGTTATPMPAQSAAANADKCTNSAGDRVGCCLYKSPTTDDQMHDVCYSIDQYVHDEHYPNFVGDYQKQVKRARTFAMLAYSFGFAAFAARVLYHIPLLSNFLGVENLAARDYWVRLADLAFLITAFIFTIMTFTELDDVLMDNRAHLWGTGGVFKETSHKNAVEEQLVAGTGFYALAVYATLLGVNVVWFLGTQVGIIPNHNSHMQGDGIELRGIAFRSEHA